MAQDIRYRKKRVGSYPYFLVLFSLVFSLTVVGLWGTVLLIGDTLQRNIKESISIQVYLHKELAPDSIAGIRKAVESKPYVLSKGGVPQLRFMSKEESAKKFIEETGEDFASFLGDNPLHDAFLVNIHPSHSTPAQLSAIKQDLQRLPGIFEVVYTEGLADAIHHNVQRLSYGAFAFTSVVCLVIFLLINNTIKLAMYSQRFLIRSMQLVGARAWFIQRPYLFRSFWLGLAGGSVAAGVILLSLHYLRSYLPEVANYVFLERELMLLLGLVLGGGLLCLISSYFAVLRYLGSRLEELY